MNYITIEAKTYEEALKKARRQYGDRLRILSRKDISKPGFMGLGHTLSCEITCFLTGEEEKSVQSIVEEEKEDSSMIRTFENEARTPNPDTVQQPAAEEFEEDNTEAVEEIEALLSDAEAVLRKNDFIDYYIKPVMEKVREQAMSALPDVPSAADIETAVLDRIAGTLKLSKETSNPGVTVFIGLEGAGKTTTLGKIAAALVKSSKVGLISLHEEGTSADILKRISEACSIPMLEAFDAESLGSSIRSFSSLDYILIDTPGQKISQSSFDRKILSALKDCGEDLRYVLVLPAYMKYSDMDASSVLFYPFDISSLAATFTDRTLSMGNVLSYSFEKKIPLEFMSFGRSIPKDLKTVAVSDIINSVKGFTRGLFFKVI